jgi:hypothetical protein
MLEKINDLAEKLATTVGQSRRGFLVRAGHAALGLFGSLLALPEEAQAHLRSGFCEVHAITFRGGGGYYIYTGRCISSETPCKPSDTSVCMHGIVPRPWNFVPACHWQLQYDPRKHCSF